MALWEQAYFVGWSLMTLGLPLAGVPVTLFLALFRPSLLALWLGGLGVLAVHPMQMYTRESRRRRIGLIMARYFTMTIIVDREDPVMKHFGTPGVDKDELRAALPVIPLACPHGVLNFGAILWALFSRWIAGIDQYTAGAPPMMYVPGMRYVIQSLWFVHADRKSLKRHLQERPSAERPRGGVVGVVPDGIAGIFHSSPGRDVLHLGGKRGLMRIAMEEGALLAAGWFSGTTDCFTVVQDPFGVMKWVSRKLRLSIFAFYGRWGLPVPRRAPTSMCPIFVRAEKAESPSEEQVEKLHQEVYGGLVRQFDRLKHYAGYGDRTLVIS